MRGVWFYDEPEDDREPIEDGHWLEDDRDYCIYEELCFYDDEAVFFDTHELETAP